MTICYPNQPTTSAHRHKFHITLGSSWTPLKPIQGPICEPRWLLIVLASENGGAA